MTSDSSGFDAAVVAFSAALEGRIDPEVRTFPDLFCEDGTIEVPFDGDGDSAPIVGRPAIERMVAGLAGFLRFERVDFSSVLPTDRPDVLVCEYVGVLVRADMPGAQRRRYISVLTLRDGRIAHIREYGGPFLPADR